MATWESIWLKSGQYGCGKNQLSDNIRLSSGHMSQASTCFLTSSCLIQAWSRTLGSVGFTQRSILVAHLFPFVTRTQNKISSESCVCSLLCLFIWMRDNFSQWQQSPSEELRWSLSALMSMRTARLPDRSWKQAAVGVCRGARLMVFSIILIQKGICTWVGGGATCSPLRFGNSV